LILILNPTTSAFKTPPGQLSFPLIALVIAVEQQNIWVDASRILMIPFPTNIAPHVSAEKSVDDFHSLEMNWKRQKGRSQNRITYSTIWACVNKVRESHNVEFSAVLPEVLQ
jgi:hypothetical protein